MEFLAIGSTGGAAYVESYCTYGEEPLRFPVIMDTAEAQLWTAYEAVKDDMLLVNQLGGIAPTIVERWMGTDKISPSSESGKQTLQNAIDALLPL